MLAARAPSLGMLLLLSATITVRAAERTALYGHVPEAIHRLGLQPVGRLPVAQKLHLAIGLPLHNQGALSNLLQQLYDPSSTNFHRYLTPDQFREQFGPTEADYQSVLEFARTNGLEVTSTFSHRQLVDVSAAVSDIEKAFHVNLRTYHHPTEARDFFAPDVEPTVSANLPILSISGLNTYARATALRRRLSNPPSGSAVGTGPFGTYQGKDFRNAYVPGVTLNGSGQYVGLVEMDGFYSSDIRAYEIRAGLPNVPITIVPLSGSGSYPDNNTNFVSEVSLDIEMVISMAPGIAGLYVFEGSNFDDVLGSMVTYRGIKQFSSSFFGAGFDSTGDNLLQTMAAQGQSFFQAAGDGDAYTVPMPPPADSKYLTSVGGTQLTMDAMASNYVSETVWNSGFQKLAWFGNGGVSGGGGYWGSGGGISPSYTIPGWQQGVNLTAVGGSTTQRNIPDVAMVARAGGPLLPRWRRAVRVPRGPARRQVLDVLSPGRRRGGRLGWGSLPPGSGSAASCAGSPAGRSRPAVPSSGRRPWRLLRRAGSAGCHRRTS